MVMVNTYKMRKKTFHLQFISIIDLFMISASEVVVCVTTIPLYAYVCKYIYSLLHAKNLKTFL